MPKIACRVLPGYSHADGDPEDGGSVALPGAVVSVEREVAERRPFALAPLGSPEHRMIESPGAPRQGAQPITKAAPAAPSKGSKS